MLKYATFFASALLLLALTGDARPEESDPLDNFLLSEFDDDADDDARPDSDGDDDARRDPPPRRDDRPRDRRAGDSRPRDRERPDVSRPPHREYVRGKRPDGPRPPLDEFKPFGGPPSRPNLPAGAADWPIPHKIGESDPELARLNQQDAVLSRESQQLSEAFKRAQGQEREELREQIEKTVNEHFEVRQHRRRLQVEQMEKELARLDEAIERRNEARDAIVGRRIKEITGEKDDLDF